MIFGDSKDNFNFIKTSNGQLLLSITTTTTNWRRKDKTTTFFYSLDVKQAKILRAWLGGAIND